MTNATNTNTASGAADLRTAAQAVVDRWDTPLWKDVPATAEYIGRLRAALAAGQATAAQAVVQDDLITIRKPTTSAEMFCLLKLAHLVISDVDKTLEAVFAPAQPAPEASRFGSPELQAMIIARCLEKDQAASVQEESARLDFLIEQRAYVVSDPDACPGYWLHWAMPDGSTMVQCDEHPTPRAAIDSARKQGATQ